MSLRWLCAATTALVIVGGTAGCGTAPPAVQCMSMGSSSGIVAAAGLVRIDIYAAGVACNGNMIAPGSQPLKSLTFVQGQEITLDVAPGKHTVALTAYADPGGTQLTGAGCVADQDFQPGQKVCIDLTVSEVDLSGPDLSVDLSVCTALDCPCMVDHDCANPMQPRCGPQGMCVPCVSTNDNCPFDQYCGSNNHCALGCKESTECEQLAVPDGGVPIQDKLCNTTSHKCVECLMQTDCAVGKLCSPSGVCVDGCDLSKGKGCAVGLTCCTNLCVDTKTDALNCNTCGMTCNGATNTCCNGVCVDPSSNVQNCNGCGKQCSTVHDTPMCNLGVCSYGCMTGYAHCQTGNSGCETPTTTTSNCAGCNNVCDVTNALSASCDGTTCSYACKPGFADCVKLGVNTNGCETNTNTDVNNCGGCTMACSSVVKNATGLFCNGGTCDYASCSPSTFADCNGVRSDGCEVNTLTDAAHCGNCATNCVSKILNATGVLCNNGGCDYASCNMGFADCDGNRANGCEVNLNTDVAHCGTCNTNCNTNVVNANGVACNGSGVCTYTIGCSAPNFADCDGNKANGCEVNTNTDTTHCGSCSTNCNTTVVNANGIACNGSGICTYTGSCSAANFADCDGNKANGCEVNTNTDTTHCGSCTTNCNTTVLNATGIACNGSGICTYTGSCTAPNFVDCDANKANGCEVNTNTDTTHCGSCTTNCNNTVANASGISCNGSGACTYSTCNTNFADCDGNKTNGCEINTSNNTTHCGTCTTNCNTNVQNASGISCASSACTYTSCNTGFFDCNANKADGCEAPGYSTTGQGCCSSHCAASAPSCPPTATGLPMVAHSEGSPPSNSNYYDCYNQGTPGTPSTYNQNMVNDAAAQATWQSGTASGGWSCPSGDTLVCKTTGSGPCTCWVYNLVGGSSATDAGHLSVSSSGCFCPGTGDPTWN